MKFSKAAIHTTKETPADADSANAKFLTQGGFIHKELAGVYTFLPLGKKVLRKIEQIVREEMQAIDSVEVGMPALTPLENWEKTGRNNVPIAYTPTDNTVLGWSHEEIVTPLAKEYIRSWKDLPLSLFQIQTKFRNEPRAKAGVLRGREFLMKDMYSFHETQKDLDEYYQKTLQAYLRVYERCQLEAYAIEASGGVFSKNISHEFAVITASGEDTVIFEKAPDGPLVNPQNAEIAVGNPPEIRFEKEQPLEQKEVKRPKDIAGTAKQYGIEEGHILKTVVFLVKRKEKEVIEGKLVGISVRGDLELNMEKIMSYFQSEDIRPASSDELKQQDLAEGFISPIQNTKIKFYADKSVREMTNFCTGANAMNQDYFHANIDRDGTFEDIADFVLVKGGFTSKETGNPLSAEKCIEAGNIFDLGTKYSEAFDLKFTDRSGKHQMPLMGCYGLGISRLVGTIVEVFHDEKGILWPKSVAPYQVILIPIGKSDSAEWRQSLSEAEKLEVDLEKAGIEVLLDDREESPGKKFADADLIGIPLRIVLSPRTLEQKSVEWKERKSEEAKSVPLAEVAQEIIKWREE